MTDVDNSSSVTVTEPSGLSAPIIAKDSKSLPVDTSRVRTAVAVPNTSSLIFVTEANQIVYLDYNVSAPAPVRSIATARYVTVQHAGLPTHCSVAIALLEGTGLVLYSLPSLEPIQGALHDSLSNISKNARLFAVDRLGTRTTDSFRIALSVADNILLLSINIPQSTVDTLSTTTVPEPAVALAFADMTIVATTARNHCMLRIARSANMAMAATVLRYDPTNRRRKTGQGGDAGTAVLSFFGGFFSRKDSSTLNNQLAFPLPDNRWVLSVDDEWVTYSAFGAKLEDMENVFKSRKAIDISENEISAVLNTKTSPNKNGAPSPAMSTTSAPPRRLRKSNSISSMTSATSVASTYTILTLVDEARASRAEKPVAVATFASPFVLCVTDNNELLAFAANGSIPGTIASLKLDEEKDIKQIETGAAIVPCMNDLCIALVYWPSGRVIEIQLADELEALINDREEKGELRSALSLVPIDQVDRTISFRRKLAVQARQDDWHDAAIHHMQHVVNLCVARDGVGQLDLITEAVELRGPRGSSWETDVIVATLWGDFLFRLRRRVMQPSVADIDIIQTLCRADVSSTRIKALLAVKHEVTMEAGEEAITAGDSALQEDERIEALVALYSSLGAHDKALVLLENSGMNRAFQVVCSFLSKNMRPDENPDVFFKHLQWVASEAKESRGREAELMPLLAMIIEVAKKSDVDVGEHSLQSMMRIVVEHTPQLLDPLIELMNPTETENESNPTETDEKLKETTRDSKEKTNSKTEAPKADEKSLSESIATATNSVAESEFKISTDLYAISLLAGMAKADILQNTDLFERLRALFRNQILQNESADYNPDKLVLALQAGHNESMSLHEERAYLLGRQGRHEAAAMELASEISLSSDEAKRRLEKLLPVSDRAMSGQALVSAYLQVSGEGRPNRVGCAADIVRQEGGYVDVEKVMVELRQKGSKLTMAEARPFLRAALISGKERLRLAELVRAMRVSEVSRVREEVLIRRRRSVMIGDGRACSICTRGIDDTSVFAARPDGTVEHLACHTSRMSSNRSQASNRSTQ